MITLAGGALVACCALGLGVWRLRRRKSRAPSGAPRTPPPQRNLIQRGEVLLFAEESLWLTGQITLREEGFAASLFAVEEKEPARWIYQEHANPDHIAILSASEELPTGAAPTEFPIGLRRLRLLRQGHARLQLEGKLPPALGSQGRFWLMTELGGLLALQLQRGEEPPLRLLGKRLPLEHVDRLPGPTELPD